MVYDLRFNPFPHLYSSFPRPARNGQNPAGARPRCRVLQRGPQGGLLHEEGRGLSQQVDWGVGTTAQASLRPGLCKFSLLQGVGLLSIEIAYLLLPQLQV